MNSEKRAVVFLFQFQFLVYAIGVSLVALSFHFVITSEYLKEVLCTAAVYIDADWYWDIIKEVHLGLHWTIVFF